MDQNSAVMGCGAVPIHLSIRHVVVREALVMCHLFVGIGHDVGQ